MASRMQTTLIGSGIQVTEKVYERLKDNFIFSDKMSTIIKGKGETPTYLLLDVKNGNDPENKRSSLIKNIVESNIQHESSKSSFSSNFNKFFLEKTNKCMADDIINTTSISKINTNGEDYNDVNGLTFDILNDSDFEDDNNSISNSSMNISELNIFNRSTSLNKTNPDNSIQNQINNEIALNINQQIQNVLTNYDQIQNLKNITDNSMSSIQDNDPTTDFLSEENDIDNENENDFDDDEEEKPSLIKGIINRTKSYQFSKRAPSTRTKRTGDEDEEIAPSMSHKNINYYNMKYNQDKNRSFNSEDVFSSYSAEANLSVDYLSEYDMISNKLNKNDKKKKNIFKSFHSFKQKSENNLSKKGIVVNTENANATVSQNTLKSNINSNRSFYVSASGIGNIDGTNNRVSMNDNRDSNNSIQNYKNQMSTAMDNDMKYYSSMDIKNTTRSFKKLIESADKKESDSTKSANFNTNLYCSKTSDMVDDNLNNTKTTINSDNSITERFDQMSYHDNNKGIEPSKESNDSLSSVEDTSPRKVSRFSRITNHTTSTNIKKRISFMSDSLSNKDKVSTQDMEKFNELRSFDTSTSTAKNNSRKTSNVKTDKSITENTIPLAIDENEDEYEDDFVHNFSNENINNAFNDNITSSNDDSIVRTAVVDSGEFSPAVRTNEIINHDIYEIKKYEYNKNNDYIINIPTTASTPSKKSISKSSTSRDKSKSFASYNSSKISRSNTKKSIHNPITPKDQEITGIIDNISKELEKIEDEEYYNTIAKIAMNNFTHIFKEASLEKVYQNTLKKQFSPLAHLKKITSYPIFLFFSLLPVCFRYYNFEYDHTKNFNFIFGEKEIIKNNFSILSDIIKKPVFIILISLFLFISLLLVIDAFFFTYKPKINNTLGVLNIILIYGISVYLIFYDFHIESYFIFIVVLVNIFYKLPFVIHSILAVSYIITICICTFIKFNMRVFIQLIMIAIPFSILLIFFLSGKEMQNRVKVK